MELDDKRNRCRLLAGRTAVIIITVHVLICLCLMFLPRPFHSNNPVVRLYRSVVLLGPFFTESRIKDSPHLTVRIKNKGHWSGPRELTQEYFTKYAGLPWRYHYLARISYVRYLGQNVGSISRDQPFETVKRRSSFRELNAFLLDDVVGGQVDSIEILYGSNIYMPSSQTFQLDTVFAYSYNPSSIGTFEK